MKNLIIATVALALASAAGRAGGDSPVPDEQMVILLQNGHVLRGAIADEGERVLIKLAPGSQVRIPRGQVAAVGRSLDDLFQVQHRQLRRNDIAGHVDLARWCQRNELPRQAGEMLVSATAIAPDDPQVIALEQQLRRTLQSQGTTEASPPSRPSAEFAVAPPPNEPHPVSPAALAEFTHQIQPMLSNHCGASGCHGAAVKSDFALIRPLQSGTWTQRLTQRNLQSAVAHVNFASAEESLLLLAATRPHAGSASPIFTSPRDDRSLQALRDWIASIGAADASQLADVDESPLHLANDSAEAENPPPLQLQDGDSPFSSARPSDKSSAFVPRDPLDPEIFNRQFFPERFDTP